MRRLPALLALLLALAACESDDPTLPPVAPDGRYLLERIDGRGQTGQDVRVISGALIIEGDRYEWTERTSLWPSDTGAVYHRGAVARTGTALSFTRLIDGVVIPARWDPPTIVAGGEPGWVYHWRLE